MNFGRNGIELHSRIHKELEALGILCNRRLALPGHCLGHRFFYCRSFLFTEAIVLFLAGGHNHKIEEISGLSDPHELAGHADRYALLC